jgi:hypothetical protein
MKAPTFFFSLSFFKQVLPRQINIRRTGQPLDYLASSFIKSVSFYTTIEKSFHSIVVSLILIYYFFIWELDHCILAIQTERENYFDYPLNEVQCYLTIHVIQNRASPPLYICMCRYDK